MENYDKNKKYQRHPRAHKKGGYHMNFQEDQKLLSIIGTVVKQIGQKISRGDFNLATLVKPAILTYQMTMLEALSNDYSYSHFYNLAAKAQDPLLRMQYVVSQTIASIHINQSLLGSKAPIDCCIGETLQVQKSDGTRFYGEFIKSDPPTSLIQLFGPNDSYKLWASDEVFAEIHPTLTQIIGRTMRKRTLKFQDGKQFQISMPTMIIEGVLNGDRILNFMDFCEVSCPQDNLYAKINFLFQYQGKVTKFAKKLSGYIWAQNDQQQLQDLFVVEIQKKVIIDDEEQKFTLSTGSGSWLSFIQFDDKMFWKFDDPIMQWQPQNQLLLSDSSFRLDRKFIIDKQMDLAQKHRQLIEEEDKRAQKLRKV